MTDSSARGDLAKPRTHYYVGERQADGTTVHLEGPFDQVRQADRAADKYRDELREGIVVHAVFGEPPGA